MPITPELAALLIQLAIKYGPELAAEISTLVHKTDATAADWAAAFRSGTPNAQKLLAEPAPQPA